MPDSPILYLALMGIIIGLGAWAGWTLGARRATTPKTLPTQLWLCEACHSFNEPERAACYACHRARLLDARTVVPDAEFHVDQRLGRAIDNGGRGASRPWIGAVEPLVDDRLAAHPDTAPPPSPADDATTRTGSTEDYGRPPPR